ncbi:kinetochore protein Spc24-like [Limulus polyphemus]|uniref:Kinetochore protein Spc24 n=1 Tax=Limulus polyphemus TaxID=6850 RepID=A0ABM1SRX9_LIMPO|nr:kinetochore protein Spc24-like [Limulus polyphemus]
MLELPENLVKSLELLRTGLEYCFEEENPLFDGIKQIKEFKDVQQNKYNESLKALQARCREEQNKLKDISVQEIYNKKIEKLQSELNSKKEQLDKIKVECSELKEAIKQKEEEKKQLDKRLQEVREKKLETIPALRKELMLYTKITGLRWDYDSSEDEIKGLIKSNIEVKPFSLNLNQNSQFFITNHLWDLIGSQQ